MQNGELSKPHVAAVAEQGSRELLERVFAAQGLDLVLLDELDELLEPDIASPALVLLWDGQGGSPARVKRVRQALAEPPVVVVCNEQIRGWELRAVLQAGAAGVVFENDLERALGPCVEAARVGQVCVPRRHRRRLDPPVLSGREKQILGLVVMGQTNGQIAERLVLAESTVKSHLSSAFAKLGVRSRNEAVDLIVDSERGLGMGILALGGDPLEPSLSVAN